MFRHDTCTTPAFAKHVLMADHMSGPEVWLAKAVRAMITLVTRRATHKPERGGCLCCRQFPSPPSPTQPHWQGNVPKHSRAHSSKTIRPPPSCLSVSPYQFAERVRPAQKESQCRAACTLCHEKHSMEVWVGGENHNARVSPAHNNAE